MRRNNVKLWSNNDIERFNGLYDISIKDDNVMVSCKNYNRIRAHPKNESFSINSKIRRITFTTDAIDIFEKIRYKYSLIEVQTAVNILYITFQKINEKNVITLLKRGI